MLNAYRLLLLLLLLLLFISLSLACRLSFFLVMRRRERKKNIKKIVVSKKKKKKKSSRISRHNFLRTNKKISLLSQQKALSFSLSLSLAPSRDYSAALKTHATRERDKDARASFFFEKILFFPSES